MHFFHCVDLFGLFVDYFPDLAEPSFSDHKLAVERVDAYLLEILFFWFFGAVFACGGSVGSRNLMVDFFQFAAWFHMFQAVQIDMPELFKSYRKFPTSNFLSFSLEEAFMPKLLFRVCRERLESTRISESLVARMSLLRLVDLRSKASWMGLTAQLRLSYVLSRRRGDSRLAYLIFLIP